jgi:hypothetical protein
MNILFDEENVPLLGEIQNIIIGLIPTLMMYMSFNSSSPWGMFKMVLITSFTPLIIKCFTILYKVISKWRSIDNKKVIYIYSHNENGWRNDFYYFLINHIHDKCNANNNYDIVNGTKIYYVSADYEWNDETDIQEFKKLDMRYTFLIKDCVEIVFGDSEFEVKIESENFKAIGDKDVNLPTVNVIKIYHDNSKRLSDLIFHLKKMYVKYEYNDEISDGSTLTYLYNEKSKGWVSYKPNIRKTFKNSIFDNTIKNEVVNRLDKWIKSRSLYEKRGLPYKIGFMFYGIPGTGKSSMIQCIANEYKRRIYYVSTDLINAELPNTILSKIKPGSILAFEDIDLMVSQFIRNNKEEKKEDMSNKSNICDKKDTTVINPFMNIALIYTSSIFKRLLDVLDGFLFLDDIIVIFTTNNKSAIDPAILRAGRIDYKFEFDYCNDSQLMELCELYDRNWENIKKDPVFNKIIGDKDGITSAEFIKRFLC